MPPDKTFKWLPVTADRQVLRAQYLGVTVALVHWPKTQFLHKEGSYKGERLRGATEFTAGYVATDEGKDAAGRHLMSEVLKLVNKHAGGVTSIRGRAVATAAGLDLGQCFDAVRERILPALQKPYRKNLERAMRHFEAVWGRGLMLHLVQQTDVTRYEVKRLAADFTLASPRGPEYCWPHPSKIQRVRKADSAGIRQDFLHLIAILNHAASIKDSTGRRLLDYNPLEGLALPEHDEETVHQEVADQDRYCRMMAVAADAERATRVRKSFTNHVNWTNGCFESQLFMYRTTGRRQNAIRLLQRRNIIFDREEAQRLAVSLKVKGAATIAEDCPFGVLVYEGWKDKGRRGRKRRTTLIPMSSAQHAHLRAYLDRMPNKAPDAWLYASPTVLTASADMEPDEAREVGAVPKKTQRDWFMRMEKLAGVPHLPRAVFHAWRRLFRNERDHIHPRVINRVLGWAERRRKQEMQARYYKPSFWRQYLCVEFDASKVDPMELEFALGGVQVDVPETVRAAREVRMRDRLRLVA